jgi:vacuolar-type H+-ATPase subunit B/Vma2
MGFAAMAETGRWSLMLITPVGVLPSTSRLRQFGSGAIDCRDEGHRDWGDAVSAQNPAALTY